jgi:uncharacterized membrane protein
MLKKISLSVMTFTYLFAGLAHWTHFGYFLSLVPSFMPGPRLWVAGSGLAEILLSFFLPPRATRKWACYILMFCLAATLPIDAFVLVKKGAGIPLSYPVLAARIPFHMALMLWAWWHGRK